MTMLCVTQSLKNMFENRVAMLREQELDVRRSRSGSLARQRSDHFTFDILLLYSNACLFICLFAES